MHTSRTLLWMTGAFAGSLVVAALTLAFFGYGQAATHIALQLTARWSYCFFLPAYAGSALAAIFGPRFQPVASRARDLGLAFAAAHLTHASLVAWLYYISPKPPVSTHSALFFGVALFLTYVLALFSIPKMAANLPPRAWWALRTFGMEYIAFAFLYDFIVVPFSSSPLHLISYIPFIAFGTTAAVLRILVYGKKLHRRWLSLQPAH